MTLKELKQRVDHFYNMNENYHDLVVCVPNNKFGQGSTPVTVIKYANKGFDWDNGLFILSPEFPMTEITNSKTK